MKKDDVYIDLDGQTILLAGLDDQERKLLARIRAFAAHNVDWCGFNNFWTREVLGYYDQRGWKRRATVESTVYRVAQDLSSRIAVASGIARLGDYRDDLEWLIRDHFKNQREFCKATGLAEDMLSHVLAGRKHLAIDTLEAALAKIGYRLRVVKLPEIEARAQKKAVKRRAIA